jgi:hypothetical protein
MILSCLSSLWLRICSCYEVTLISSRGRRVWATICQNTRWCRLDLATELIPCQVVSFSIWYLGVPLLVTKLPRLAWQSLLDKATDRLPTWKGNLLKRSGRLALISAIPIYVSIGMGLSAWVHSALIKLMKACLWLGLGVVQGGKCLIAWNVVHRPRQVGDLGILDLKMFGHTLSLRWLWLQKTDPDRA